MYVRKAGVQIELYNKEINIYVNYNRSSFIHWMVGIGGGNG